MPNWSENVKNRTVRGAAVGMLSGRRIPGPPPDFYLRWVRVRRMLVNHLEAELDWELVGVASPVAIFKKRARIMWVAVLSDGELHNFIKRRGGDDVMAFSWSGRFFTSGPCRNTCGGSPVKMCDLFSGWRSSRPVRLPIVQRLLSGVKPVWDHGSQPRVTASEGQPLSLPEGLNSLLVGQGLH